MRYKGRIYRPPSEADALIVQATIGCSWNRCVYCDMYRDKEFSIRPLPSILEDLHEAGHSVGQHVRKVFFADGDALTMPISHWAPILEACRARFPNLERMSCYAMAKNCLEKSESELEELRALGLSRLYIGPESGDDDTLRRLAKGQSAAEHVQAAHRAKRAGMALSVIFLLGAAGRTRSLEHARASGELATEMDPEFLAALTTTVVPGTPLAKLERTGRYERPTVLELLAELRELVVHAHPTDALFRTNHASNYLPIGGRLPRDRDAIVAVIDEALSGRVPLKPEGLRAL